MEEEGTGRVTVTACPLDNQPDTRRTTCSREQSLPRPQDEVCSRAPPCNPGQSEDRSHRESWFAPQHHLLGSSTEGPSLKYSLQIFTMTPEITHS